MKKIITIGGVVLLASICALLLFAYKEYGDIVERVAIENVFQNEKESAQESVIEEEMKKEEIIEVSVEQNIHQPLERADERITKKPFGILIDPETSPVQPERFSGYHTGTDFEVFDDELKAEVLVYAICDGKILSANKVDGYGGVITQSCVLGDQSARVLYGHVSMGNSLVRVGDPVTAGDTLTALGKHESDDTDGERKHLHLSIIKGDAVDLRGYVQNKKELNRWINFETL